MRLRRLACFALLLFAALPSALAAETAADMFTRAGEHYARRTDPQEAKLAAEGYAAATAADPKNFDAWWRLSRAYWWLGDHSPKAKRVALFEQGQAAAEKAIALDPKRTEGHYWLGVNLGRKGEEQGVLNSLFLVDPIAKEMDAVLAIDPKHAEALIVLSSLYRQAPGWPVSKGDMKKSLACAQQAVASKPELVAGHLYLARTLLALGRKDDARKSVEAALAAPGIPEEQPEAAQDKTEARKLQQEIK